MPAVKRDSVLLWVLSIGLSMLLWLQVSGEKQPDNQLEFAAKLYVEGLGPGLAIIDRPETIPVIARGPQNALDMLEQDSVLAYVDVTGLTSGSARLSVTLTESPDTRIRLEPRNAQLLVLLATVMREQRTVIVETRGTRPPDLEYRGATVSPSVVEIVAPETAMRRIATVRATLNLNLIRPGVSYETRVEILDPENRPVPGATAEPATVAVLPAVSAGRISSEVTINPDFRGLPAFGFEIESFEVEPARLRVTGPSEEIAALVTIPTAPVNLAGLRADQEFRVAVQFPPEVRAIAEDEVVVRVKVRRREGS